MKTKVNTNMKTKKKMTVLQALLKQFFGPKYERVGKTLFICLILYNAVRLAEIRMEIAPSVLFLTATAFSAGIMWQSLDSPQNADTLAGLFALPFENRNMTFSIAGAFAAYTLATKTFPALALFWAVGDWNVAQILTSVLCACNGCFAAAAFYTIYTMKDKKWLFLSFLWCGSVLISIFQIRDTGLLALSALASLILAFFRLFCTDAYTFYRPVSAKTIFRRAGKNGNGSVFVYLLRYFVTNRSYLMNTAGLCVIGGVLPFLLGQSGGIAMPLGFAVLCLNTPICILLSCDPGLEQAVRVLPGQAVRFCTKYCIFIFAVNMIAESVYLISWHVQHGGVGGLQILTALLVALQAAVLSVILEWFYPIRGWKVENDLWHHPRKYLVPVMMIFLAGLIGIWPVSLWVLSGVVLMECICLPLIAEKIEL